MRVDLPPPDTPVMAVRCQRNLDRHVLQVVAGARPPSASAPSAVARFAGTFTWFAFEILAGEESGLAITSSGVPSATISPPWIPAPGPMSNT